MSAIDLERFEATPLAREPYEHLIVPGFLAPGGIGAIEADWPRIDGPGSFPLSGLEFGPDFASLIEELRGTRMQDAFAAKFGIDLTGRPTVVTVRGHCQAKDGRIHTDTKAKIITVLIYMNTKWADQGGRLRVLRSDRDLEDYAAEVPPDAGTLLAFRRGERSWHGHHGFVGERRVIQLNWLTDEATARRETRRHRLSAWMKKLAPAG